MAFQGSVALNLLCISALAILACFSIPTHAIMSSKITRSDFPKDFLFGASTSALQIEGSSTSDGKGESIWDYYSENKKVKVIDDSNITTSIDSYRRYREDLIHLKNLGVSAFRFSIAWTRIIPDGSLKNGVNQQGIDHYNLIINTLIEYGIKPVVTLYHFDYPDALERKYGAFLSRSIVDDFRDYTEVCFKAFGDRVKTWITINEPYVISAIGYDLGQAPPVRCSDRKMCTAGNSSTEPYIVTHNLMLSHAAIVKLYREKFQPTQKGEIGMSLVGQYYEPYTNSTEDIAAQKRALDFGIGWFMEPLVYGDYPSSMKKLVKERLPTFTEEEKKSLIGAFDFIGVNYYSSLFARNIPINLNATPISYTDDQFAFTTATGKDGKLIGRKYDGISSIYYYPEGLQKVLEYLNATYKSPKIYITENGVTEMRNDSLDLIEEVDDPHRILYIRGHIHHVNNALRNGVNVKGYFYWSLFDSFEFYSGYTTRFGLYYIDYKDDLKRIPKSSAIWYRNFLRQRS
ncbi:beta-glucosidase 24-like [Mercurialis annua]|uniref:beta-glucosidase 24-like n=1 Tax=Mercurialis annua TaxID=3986 RepID=UPI00215E0B0E|nr:beta-glucosidase 24-like [Mercurialis annua]